MLRKAPSNGTAMSQFGYLQTFCRLSRHVRLALKSRHFGHRPRSSEIAPFWTNTGTENLPSATKVQVLPNRAICREAS